MFKIVNYIIRILIIVIGIIFVSGLIVPADGDVTRFRVMGVIFILFGFYRVAMYRMKSKQYDFNKKTETDNTNLYTEENNTSE